MTKHPQGLRYASKKASKMASSMDGDRGKSALVRKPKVWTVDGDRGQSAYALVNESKVQPGDNIYVESANQLGSYKYEVVLDEHGKKSLKTTYDPNYPEDYMGGGKSRKARKNTKSNRKRKGNTRKNRK
jgi:hypothetical protein